MHPSPVSQSLIEIQLGHTCHMRHPAPGLGTKSRGRHQFDPLLILRSTLLINMPAWLTKLFLYWNTIGTSSGLSLVLFQSILHLRSAAAAAPQMAILSPAAPPKTRYPAANLFCVSLAYTIKNPPVEVCQAPGGSPEIGLLYPVKGDSWKPNHQRGI